MSCLIFANGDIADYEWIRPFLTKASLIIAANGGSRHLFALQQPPSLVIGDVDSLPHNVRDWLHECKVPLRTHPRTKDETDLELALLYAVEHHDEDIRLIGGLGGRLDQTLANILLLVHPELAGRQILFQTEFEQAWMVWHKTAVHGQVGDTVSLIPLGGDVRVQQTTGLRWPLNNDTLAFGPARGISNELTENIATVTVSSGQLLCIHTQQRWGR